MNQIQVSEVKVELETLVKNIKVDDRFERISYWGDKYYVDVMTVEERERQIDQKEKYRSVPKQVLITKHG